MRIILGTTTRSEILAFCPTANVGIPWTADLKPGDEKDIRWAAVPSPTGPASEMLTDGDWLVELPDGGFSFMDDASFHARYEADQ